MSCATCGHFVAGVHSLAAQSPNTRWETAPEGHGICRRYPPRFIFDAEQQETLSLFPSVHRAQSCGEYDSGVPL